MSRKLCCTPMDFVPHQTSPSSSEAEEAIAPSPVRRRWSFLLMVPVLLALPVGVAFFALSDLLQLPAMPKCFNAQQAPPADQIYCANQLASKHDTDSLRRAILLANAVDCNHPLRKEGDRLINVWTTEILRRAEETFQEGDLQGAIAIAEKVPGRVPSYDQVRDTIRAWEELWAEAEELYQEGQRAIEREDWYDVLAVGRRLLQLDNRYWTTDRYQGLMRQLQTARENQKKESNKNKIARSPLNARNRQPVTVEDFLSQWEAEQEQEDRARLQQARQNAQSDNVEGLRAAISQAQGILYGTASYDEAQQAIAQWRQQLETLEDRPYLERAQQLANQGDLQAAINEASNIGWGRALYGEARDRISVWRDQVYQQDRQQWNAELERITGQPAAAPPPLPAPGRSPTPVNNAFPEPLVAPTSPTVPVSNNPVVE